MREQTAHKLLKHVKDSYNLIANEFSESRNRPWDEFKYFEPYLKQNSEIVDLGCGNGRLYDYLQKYYLKFGPKSFHYIGIDNSEGLLNHAKTKYHDQIFMLGDQLKIPLDENQADLIMNIAAFHHIPGYSLRLQALYEMKRVLKKDGYLIMTVWNLWQPKYLKVILKALANFILSLGNFSPNDFQVPWGNEKHPRYYHAFLPAEVMSLVKKAGFEIVETFSVKKGVKTSFFKSFNFCIIAKKISE